MMDLILAAVFAFWATGGFAAPRAVDGDTIALGSEHWRLSGLNCPESDTVEGDAATAAMAALLTSGPVTCEWTGQYSHERKVGHCKAGGRDLAEAMIVSGVCGRCDRYDPDGLYVRAQEIGGYQGRFPKYCIPKKRRN